MDTPPFPGKDERNFLVNLSSATLSDSRPLQRDIQVGRVFGGWESEERREGVHAGNEVNVTESTL